MKKINRNELIWCLLIGALMIGIGKLLLFNELRFYLHPKMNNLVIFAELMLIVLFAYQLTKIFGKSSQKLKWGHIMFVIPILMFVLAGNANAVVFENRTLNLVSQNTQNSVKNNFKLGKTSVDNKNNLNQTETEKENLENEVPNDTYSKLPADQFNSPDPLPENLKEGKIIDPSQQKVNNESQPGQASINEKSESTEANISENQIPANEVNIQNPETGENDPFLETLFSLDVNSPSSIGREIVMEGFVYRDESFAENEFSVSRMIITCCVADAMVGGIIVRSQLAQSYQANDWVRVTGIVQKSTIKNPYTNTEEPGLILEAKKIEKIEPYETPYVYFSY